MPSLNSFSVLSITDLKSTFVLKVSKLLVFGLLYTYLSIAISKSIQSNAILDSKSNYIKHKDTDKQVVWDETTINTFLRAEFLAQEKQFETAALVLWDTAQKQPIPNLLERVIQWSLLSKRFDMGIDAAELWKKTDKQSIVAQNWIITLLILSERYGDLSNHFKTYYNYSKITPSPDQFFPLIALIHRLKLPESQQQLIYQAVKKGLQSYQHIGDVQFLYSLLAQEAHLKNESKQHINQALASRYPSAMAIIAQLSEHPNNALNAAKKWTKHTPYSFEAWNTLSQLYISLNKPKLAVDALNQALMLSSKYKPKYDEKIIFLLLIRMQQERLSHQFIQANSSLKQAYTAKKTLSKHNQIEIARILAQELEQSSHSQYALEIYEIADALNKKVDENIDDISTVLDNKKNNTVDNFTSSNNKEMQSLLIRSRLLSLKAKLADKKALEELLALQAGIQHIIEKKEEPAYLKQNPNLAYSLIYATIDTLQTLAQRPINTSHMSIEAQNQFDLALRLCKQLPTEESLYSTAIIYELMNKVDESHNILRNLLKKSPKNPLFLNALGYSLVNRNANNTQLIEGIALLEIAYTLEPDDMAINDSLGWGYFRAKHYSKALPLLKKAYRIRPNAEVAAHLGELLFVIGQTKTARNIWLTHYEQDQFNPILLKTINRFNIKVPAYPK